MVTHVSDGDTLWVRPDAGGDAVNIRIDGIDAPEICQAWGAEAQAALASRVLHRAVNVNPRRRDGYGRLLASLSEPGTGADLGEWMVANGHAWAHQYKRFKSTYGAQLSQAQGARRGLFADAQAVHPRDFRKRHGPCLQNYSKSTARKKVANY